MAQNHQRWIVSQWGASAEQDPVRQVQHFNLMRSKHPKDSITFEKEKKLKKIEKDQFWSE